MRFVLVFVALAVSAAGGALGGYQEWRAKYEASLKAPDGWLSVAGLFWLHEGENAVQLPQKTVMLRLDSGKVTFENRPLKTDATDHPDVLKFGDVSLTIIERGGRMGVRLRDPNAETRRDFTGCKWFPADPAWRIDAKWIAYPTPKTISIADILGLTEQEPSPGYAEFTLQGKRMTLQPILDDRALLHVQRRDQRQYHLRRRPVPLRRRAERKSGRAGFQQGAQSALRIHRLCHVSAAAETEHSPRRHRYGEKSYGKH